MLLYKWPYSFCLYLTCERPPTLLAVKCCLPPLIRHLDFKILNVSVTKCHQFPLRFLQPKLKIFVNTIIKIRGTSQQFANIRICLFCICIERNFTWRTLWCMDAFCHCVPLNLLPVNYNGAVFRGRIKNSEVICKLFEHLYGTTKCTPNMHLSCHLVECTRDYGPVYSFWCFSFERYNGILGSYHKNNHNIGKLSHFCIVWYYSKSKLKQKLYKNKSSLKIYKTEIRIHINPGLAKPGFEQPSPVWK